MYTVRLDQKTILETISEMNGCYFAIALTVFPDLEEIVLVRGDLSSVILDFVCFESSGTNNPDFSKIEIIDYGQTIKLGEYEVSVQRLLEQYGYL